MLAHKVETKTATKVQIAGRAGRMPLRESQGQTRTDQAVPKFGSREVEVVSYEYGAAANRLAYS